MMTAMLLLTVFGCVSMVRACYPPLRDVQAGVTIEGQTRTLWFKVNDPVSGWMQNTVTYPGDASSYWAVGNDVLDGVVTWSAMQYVPGHNGNSAIGYAIYDPQRGWMRGGKSYSGDASNYWGVSCSSSQGVVTWAAHQYVPGHDGNSEIGYAVYDPSAGTWVTGSRTWEYTSDSHWNSACETQEGIVTWFARQYLVGRDGDTQVGYAVYDPTRSAWVTGMTSSSPPATLGIHIGSCSAHIVRNGQESIMGYDAGTGAWASGTTRPLAYFTASATTGNAPLFVWVTDMSIGSTGWSWSFGDGGTSSERSLSHTYTASGVFTLTQWVTGPGGNTSRSVTVTTDTSPPTGTIVINNNAAYTNSAQVVLTLSATDNSGTVSTMQFSNDGTNWSGWESYAATKAWSLPGATDGAKTVYVQFKDVAGNVSGAATDAIVLDTTAPTGSIAINNGASATNNTAVTLTLNASDAGSVASMQFSNDYTNWSGWEPYAATRAWTLPAGEGERTVYVQFKDAAGNTSLPFQDTILLDATAPSITTTTPAHQATNVLLDAGVTVTFSEPVYEGAHFNEIRATADGNLVSCAGAIANRILTLTIPLAYGTTYEVILPAGAVIDAAGNGLVGSFSYRFTTQGFQPDAMICAGDAGAFTGEDLYNSLADQTVAQSVATGSVSYRVNIRNDGISEDRIRVQGTGGDADWSIRYEDALTGTALPEQIIGEGWLSPALAPGASCEIRIVVRPLTTQTGAVKNVLVTATSATDTRKTDQVASVTTRAAALTAVRLICGMSSPQPAGTPITLTAVPTGGLRPVFQFRAGYPSEGTWNWIVLRDYASTATTVWSPTEPRRYTLVVLAREEQDPEFIPVSQVLSFLIAPPLTAVHLTVTPPEPTIVNTTLTLTAAGTGGANVEYLFRAGYRENGVWQWFVIRGYRRSPTCAWTPDAARTYLLAVWAREASSNAPYQVSDLRSYRVAPPLTGVSLSAAPPAPQQIGTPVTLTATPTGGARVEYLFRVGFVEDGTWYWTMLRGYRPSPCCVWTPTTARSYRLVVLAREVGSSVSYQVSATIAYPVTAPLAGVRLSTEPSAPQLAGTPVTLIATPTGGTSVEYLFRVGFVENGLWYWSVLRGYRTTRTCTWTPATARTYTLVVWTREAGNPQPYQVSAVMSYTVRPVLSAVTLAADPPSPQPVNTPITLTAVPNGGLRVEYQFKVGFYEGNVWYWATLRDYSEERTVQWTPGTARQFSLSVNAREVGGTIPPVTGTIQYAVFPP